MEYLLFFFLEKAKIIEKEKMYPMALLLWNRAAIQGIEPDLKNEHYLVPVHHYSSGLLQLSSWDR